MNLQPKRILVIDKQDYWRKLSTHVLEQAGFTVAAIDNYAYPHDDAAVVSVSPDLVVLGCAAIGFEEQTLIRHILDHKHRLLVLSTSLPWQVMRSLFLLGADDVADKPYDARYLLKIVEGVLNGHASGVDDAEKRMEVVR